jgi:hypothetical protein
MGSPGLVSVALQDNLRGIDEIGVIVDYQYFF